MFIHRTKNIENLDKLLSEVQAIIPKVQYVVKFGESDLRFTINESLTPEESTSLNNLLENFVDSVITSSAPKIYDLAKEDAGAKHFHNIDYKRELVHSLIPVRTIEKGEVVNVKWYRAIDGSNTPIDLIINVDISYNRDSSGFALSRTTVRTWINEDESENIESKLTVKYYFLNYSDMIAEGLKRRRLLVDNLQIPTLGFMKEVLLPLGYEETAVLLRGREFMDRYDDEFSKFVTNSSTITDPSDPDFGKKSVIVALEDKDDINGFNKSHAEWLDKSPASLGGLITIRQYLISEFTI